MFSCIYLQSIQVIAYSVFLFNRNKSDIIRSGVLLEEYFFSKSYSKLEIPLACSSFKDNISKQDPNSPQYFAHSYDE